MSTGNRAASDVVVIGGGVIGLAIGQDFNIAETAPYSPLASITQEQALRTAQEQRPDYQSAKAQVRAAEETVRATRAER